MGCSSGELPRASESDVFGDCLRPVTHKQMFIITQADKAQKETDDITTIIMMYVKLRAVTMGFPSESSQESEKRLIT